MNQFYHNTALLMAGLVYEPGTMATHQFLRNAADQAWLRFQTLRDGRLKVLELTTADFDTAAVHHRVACQLLRISSG